MDRTSAVPEQAQPIPAADLAYVRQLVFRHSGVALEADKSYLLESRLAPIVRREGLGSIPGLIATLRTRPFASLHEQVVDALLTKETSFFRTAKQFEALWSLVLPDLRPRRAPDHSLGIWSAACSTGQEPYSIAMLLREQFPAFLKNGPLIIASDLSPEALARARAGLFDQIEVNRGLPASLLVRYFAREGLNWRVREDVRRMVEFRQLNLAAPWPLLPRMDVVFLCNVLIYFDVETKRSILARVRSVLRPDGYLFLGGAETLLSIDDAFEAIHFNQGVCYRLRHGRG